MPIYGDAKKRQMARSILPSKSSNGGRRAPTKQHIKGAERSRVRDQLARINCLEDAEEWDGEFTEPRIYRGRIRDFVRNRRDADKLNHFIRWAKVTVLRDEIKQEDRKGYFKSILPSGLIGDHALGHLEYTVIKADDITLNSEPRPSWRNNQKQLTRLELTERLTNLLHSEGHGGLNAVLYDHVVKKVTGYHVEEVEAGVQRLVEDTTYITVRAPQLRDVASIPSFVEEVFNALEHGKALPWYFNEHKGLWMRQECRQYYPDWYVKVVEYTSYKEVLARAIRWGKYYKGMLIIKKHEPTFKTYYNKWTRGQYRHETGEFHITLENGTNVPHNKVDISLLTQ